MRFASVWVVWQTKGHITPICAFASHDKAIAAASNLATGDELPDDYVSELAYDADGGTDE